MPRAFAAAAFALLVASSSSDGQEHPVQQLDTVRVDVASRVSPSLVSAQRSVEVISRAAIDRQAARTVTDALASAVGMDIRRRSAAQANIALRGSSLGQVLILVDGVRVNDLQTPHFDLDLAVPLDAVEQIEIMRGPGAALYGSDAVGGVVNIVTRRGERWRRATVHAGNFGIVGGALGASRPVGGRTHLRGAADAERSSGHRRGTDYHMAQGTAGLDRDVGSGRLSADAGVAARDFGAADFYAPAPSYERTRTQSASVRFTGVELARWSLSSMVAGRRHTDDFILRRDDPAFYRNRHTTLQRTLEVDARRPVGGAGGLAVGVEGFDAELASARLGNRREQRLSAFAEGSVGRVQSASLNAGLRVDHATSLGTFASPSVSASVPVHRTTRLRASAGRGLRAPSWTERYYVDPANVASPDVGPERFTAAEVGLRTIARWGSVDVASFIREARGLIDWVRPAGAPATTPWTTANLESATYRGVEATVLVPALLGLDWTLSGTGLRFDADVAPGTVGKYALRPLTRVLAASASYQRGRVRMSLDARDARRAGEPRYLHANARALVAIGRGSLMIDLTNLTGATYLDAAAKPVAGRGIVAGIRL